MLCEGAWWAGGVYLETCKLRGSLVSLTLRVSKTEFELKPAWLNLAVRTRLVVQMSSTKNTIWFLEVLIQTGVQVSVHWLLRIDEIKKVNF